ncbi:hypothetical protein FKW77_001871 [Venturia effusa]|uniref:Uncharacterized protein n=1 Tax=Venturia effusa TaxID=50376 RepID=A0A517LRF1_9PEZI|nr:hypothetical protein FKW77_001871 [Venturia effusa]
MLSQQHYAVDVQGIILKGVQDPALNIDKLTRVERGVRPPTHLPLEIERTVDQNLAHIPKGTNLYWSEKRKILKHETSQFYTNWHAKNLTELPSGRNPSSLIPDSAEFLGDLALDDTISSLIRERYAPEYDHISTMYHSNDYYRVDKTQLLKDLVRLSQDGPTQPVFYRPNERPIETQTATGLHLQCPYCEPDLSRYHPSFQIQLL